jgi:hypothetical protein
MNLTKEVKISNINKLEFYKNVIDKNTSKSYQRNKKIEEILDLTQPTYHINLDVSETSRLVIPLHDNGARPTEVYLSKAAGLAQSIIINLSEDQNTIIEMFIEFRILESTPMGKILKEMVDFVELIPMVFQVGERVNIIGFFFSVKL